MALELAYGVLTCLGRHTITGMLTTRGKQFVDWSSAYRLFGKNRIDTGELFKVARQGVLDQLPRDGMIIVHMDDTIIRKAGKKIPGTSWRRDPLSPAFHTNFVWGQRFIQISMALPDGVANCQSKAIPIDFHHCPTVKRPAKDADALEVSQFKEQKKIARLSKQGALRIESLRKQLDEQGVKEKTLYVSVDGSYSNETVLKSLPARTVLIGRIRKDTKFYGFPMQGQQTGRKKVYGDRLPTPEQIRQEDQAPWQLVKAWAAGKSHDFKVKVVRNIRWRSAGESHDLQLVIIKALSYRLSASSRLLYRDPAYLICTDNSLSIEKLIQTYLWRWEIELNFRDEKTLLGCGEAQVRNPNSAEKVPAFTVAAYSLVHLAAHNTFKERDESILPRAKWDPPKENQRLSTNEVTNLLRAQLWSQSTGNSFSGFVKNQHQTRSQRNLSEPQFAPFYVRK
jgi:hypothetical protein